MSDLDLVKMFEGLNSSQAKDLTERIRAAVEREYQDFKQGANMTVDTELQRLMNIHSEAHEKAEREAQERAQAEAEREAGRLRVLEEKRQARQLQETYTSLSAEERAGFDRLTDQRALVERLTEQARQEVDREVFENSRAQMEAEFADWRTKHPRATQWELHKALQEIKQQAAERAAAWQKARADLQLEAEAFDDPIDRALATLGREDREVFHRLLKEQPSLLEQIEGVKMNAAQRKHGQLQTELRPKYEAELAQARTPSWKSNVRAKYRALGLDV